jgi:hypothetical protein
LQAQHLEFFSPKLEQIYDTPSKVNQTYTSKIDFFKKKEESNAASAVAVAPAESKPGL